MKSSKKMKLFMISAVVLYLFVTKISIMPVVQILLSIEEFKPVKISLVT